MNAGQKKPKAFDINILLVDPDKELSMIIKQVLRSLGFTKIYTASDGSLALSMMDRFSIDLVITDLEMQPVGGIEFIRHVRRDAHSPNPCIPIIMLTAQARRAYVEAARDSGMTEFLAKPFTAKDLCQRIIKVIDSPRDFVATPVYMGPDRRRKKTPVELEQERRNEDEYLIVDNHSDKIAEASKDTSFFMIRNDNRIRSKLGGFRSAAELFSEENIKEAQKVINASRSDFKGWFVSDLETLERLFAYIEQQSSDALTSMGDIALQIKGRAGTFGYDLASKVAFSLHVVCAEGHPVDTLMMTVIRKHIDVLYVIVRRDIMGDGDEIGRELMDGLDYISKRYKT
jgi:CheY-like chemotaxis protein